MSTSAAASNSAAGNSAPAAASSSQAAGQSQPAAGGSSSAAAPAGAGASSPAQANAAPAQTSAAAPPAADQSIPYSVTAGLIQATSIDRTGYTSVNPTPFVSDTAQKAVESKGLSAGAIGGIAGGVVGLLATVIIGFFLWRQCRGRGEKVAPPPPREVSYVAPSYGSPRMSSMSARRQSSYSTLLQNGRPSSHFNRQSVYSTYPVTSPPSSFGQGNSPHFGAVATPSGSPSLSSSGTGANTPGRPPLAHIDTTHLQGDGSNSSGSIGDVPEHDLPRQASYPVLRRPASGDALREPTPSDGVGPSDSSDSRTNTSDSLTNSPRPSSSSLVGLGQRSHRNGGSISSLPHSHHSMSMRGLTPRSGAPHAGRTVQITMPRPLSVASNGSEGPAPVPRRLSTYSSQGGQSQRSTMYGVYGEFGHYSQPLPTSPSHRRTRSGSHGGSFSMRGDSVMSMTAVAEPASVIHREDIV